jgi:replicative DNA helicase
MAKHTAAELQTLIYSPSKITTLYTKYAEKMVGGKGVRWGVPAIDRIVIPAHPGDVVALIARPGHAKTSISCYLARTEANRIIREELKDKVVVYVSIEQAVEEMEAFFQSGSDYSATDMAWGRVPMETIIKKSLERVEVPVWLMGESATERIRHPRMTVENIYGALQEMGESFGKTPSLVIIDYVQIIAVETYKDRVAQVGEAVVRSKELAKAIQCPVILCAQASRIVDTYAPMKMPQMGDAQWASAIEQTADKIFGLWRPILTDRKKEEIKVNGTEYPITDNLIVIKLLKQRFEKAGRTWALDFAPEYVQLAEMEITNHSPKMTYMENREEKEGFDPEFELPTE